MQIEQMAEREEERLSTAEVYALRARLLGENSVPREVATVADLAAVSGRSEEEVWQQLDRLRAERAFEAYTKRPRRFQIAIVAMAAVVAAGAFSFYRAAPPEVTDAEMEARLQELRNRAAKEIRYPVQSSVPVDQAPFPEFVLTVKGLFSTTTIKPGKVSGPVTPDEARRALTTAMVAAYEKAILVETTTPPPPVPVQRSEPDWVPKPSPRAMAFTFGAVERGATVLISTNPKLGKAQIAQAASDQIRLLQTNQENGLKRPSDPRIVVPPPGFGLSVQIGETSKGFGGGATLAFRPIDAGAVRSRLEETIRNAIRQAVDQMATRSMRPANEAAPTEAVVAIIGPVRPYDIRLPLREGGKYATAADAFRAFEAALQAGLAEAVRQVEEANAGKGRE